jgi:GDPmannose 4,6-dehydratase
MQLTLFAQTSFELPVYTAQVDAVGTLNALEAVRQAGLAGKTKFYQVRTIDLPDSQC